MRCLNKQGYETCMTGQAFTQDECLKTFCPFPEVDVTPYDRLVFVDTEVDPIRREMTEFGAVHFTSRQEFHGVICEVEEGSYPPVWTGRYLEPQHSVMRRFVAWLQEVVPGKQPTFITDNLAFDWKWMDRGFVRAGIENPFGYSGRRINDFYAGLTGDFFDQNAWKSLRTCEHTHVSVEDARGNAGAFYRILQGERGK